MRYQSIIRFYSGTPPAEAFAAATGSPIIIDTLTSIAYYLTTAGVVTALAGSSSSGGAEPARHTLLGGL
jgi:hypothetical protein